MKRIPMMKRRMDGSEPLLTPEERFEQQQLQHENRLLRLERVAKMRREGASIRAIAKAESISIARVQDDLKLAKEQGLDCSPPPEVEGLDGKSYPGRSR